MWNSFQNDQPKRNKKPTSRGRETCVNSEWGVDWLAFLVRLRCLSGLIPGIVS